MALKLSIFTTLTDPGRRGDNWLDALNCYQDLADELIIVNGGNHLPINWYRRQPRKMLGILNYPWPQEFEWSLIGEQFQRGYDLASGDWVIHMDADFLFHEQDFEAIRRALEEHPNSPGLSFWKYQFIMSDRYNLKSRLVLAVNKRLCGDRIKFNSGGDLCQPSLDGDQILPSAVPEARVPVYNYEKITKNADQIADDCGRMERAWHRHFGVYQMGSDGTDEFAFNQYIKLLRGRVAKDQKRIPISEHPKYIQQTIKKLHPDQFGYNNFGLFGEGGYARELANA